MIRVNLITIFLAIFSLLILSYQITKPFVGHHDFNNVFYGNMARNLVRYGPVATKLGQITNSGWVNPENFTYHTHHPPFLIWLLAASYWIFGISEFSTRFVPIIFSTLTLVVFYQLLKKVVDEKVALFSCFFWIATPLYLYFGKMAVQEILVLFFAIFSFWQYFFWRDNKNSKNFALLLAGLLGGTFSGWPGYYPVVIILVLDIAAFKKIRPDIIPIATIPLFAFGFQLFQNYLLTGSAIGGGFDKAFFLRSEIIPWGPYLKREASWILSYFTKPLVLAATFGLFYNFRKIILIFLILGILHLLIFRQAAEKHDYLIYYLLPFFSLSTSLFIKKFFNRAFYRIGLILLVLELIFGYRFFIALQNSDYAKAGLIAGELIQQTTKQKDKTILVDPDIFNNYDWQVIFYSDRFIRIVPQESTDITSYNWLVTKGSGGKYIFKQL